MLYVNSNGTILSNDGPTIHSGNRGHLYGDGVFESIRIIRGMPVNLDNHIVRLMEGAEIIKMRPPSYFSASFFEEKIIDKAIKANCRWIGGCRL